MDISQIFSESERGKKSGWESCNPLSSEPPSHSKLENKENEYALLSEEVFEQPQYVEVFNLCAIFLSGWGLDLNVCMDLLC